MTELTDKQKELIDFVIAGHEMGRSPTLKEMREHSGLRSSESIKARLNSLIKKGYLEKAPGHRGIAPLKFSDGRTYLSMTERAESFLRAIKKDLGASHPLVKRFKAEVLGDGSPSQS